MCWQCLIPLMRKPNQNQNQKNKQTKKPPKNQHQNSKTKTQSNQPTLQMLSVSHRFTSRIVLKLWFFCCKLPMKIYNQFLPGHQGFLLLNSRLRIFYHMTITPHHSALFWQHLFLVFFCCCFFKSAFSTMEFISLPFFERDTLIFCTQPSHRMTSTHCCPNNVEE